MADTTFDEAKSEAFADRMVGVLNEGAIALMTSIGHRTGLFDAMSGRAPSTSKSIAAATGLNERYVREWLGAMVTGGIVDYATSGEKYSLPAEHAAFLTRDAAPDNLAAFAQYVGLLGSVEDRIVDCFRNGGGVPYSGFPRFQEVMAEDSGQTVLPALIEQILPLASGVVERLREGIDVVDVGCGSGRALMLMAAEFPASRFAGYEISESGLEVARALTAEKGLGNLSFELIDVTQEPIADESRKFDLITTFDAVHDQVAPDALLAWISGALRLGGTYLMQDIAGSSDVSKNVDHPMGPFLYTVSTMHCMTVSLAGDGAGLGTMWGEDLALSMLHDAGFTSVEIKRLDHDIQNAYYVSRKD